MMNETTRRLWNAGYTKKAWCAKHKFNVKYMSLICIGQRGKYNVGEAQRIKEALKAGGFWVEPSEQRATQGV